MAIYDVSTNEKKANPELVAGGTLYADNPIGTILPYGGASAPSGWFLCQGQALSRTTYSELFAVIGTSFGVGDGSTTFNLPDGRGEFLRGAGTNSHSGQGDGGTVGEHQDATEILNYYANSSGGIDFSGGNNYNVKNSDATKRPAQSNTTISGTAGTGNVTWNAVRPTNTSVNYIIKAKMTAVPADFLAKVDEAVEQIHNNVFTLLSTSVTTTATNYTLMLNRKLSDYDYLIIQQLDAISVRNSDIVHLNQFETKRVILSSLHGANSASASDYSVSTLNVSYVDDTTISAYATGSAMINTLEILGVKLTM